ncbi:MAG: redox-regulated ATPase YchF [Treponema sp.]|jgi:GTP-binding protein YchF|nr:redox-regulated ATPase YchF [Treponema sp.]
MALNCGIVGLPNVGKSTIFSALSSTPAEAANYPFSTIVPNIGIVDVPDDRLYKLSEIFKPKRTIPATVEFVDISGLKKGSSKGEGLGNQFLSHIREVGVIAHIVRCFDDPDIVHVSDHIDPASDIETINIELALADLETLAKRRERAERALKVQNKIEQKAAETVLSILDRISPALENGRPIRSVPLSDDEKAAIYDCHFITAKPQLYVCNVDEEGMKAVGAGKACAYVEAVRKQAADEGSPVVVICGKFEAELSVIEDPEEKMAFLEELGIRELGLSSLIHAAYGLLGLRTFFTTGEDECRAWTIHAGDPAPKAARAIHTDFEKGFIKADVYTYDDIVKYGTEAKIKEAGKYRIEGKEYIVQDGDVLFFKFNV